jgi:alpha-2-macroglobulin
MQKYFHIILVLLVTAVACNNSSNIPVYNPEFVQHISAYTSGVIERDANIQVVISEPLKDSKRNKIDPNDLIDFSPNINGTAKWLDNRTIEFIPNEKLPRGTVYQGVFYLGHTKNVKRELKKFPFRFETREQKLKLVLKGLRTYGNNNPKYRMLKGHIATSDREEFELISKCLTAQDGSKKLKIKWLSHSSNMFHFRIDSLERGEFQKQISLKLSGKEVESSSEDVRTVNMAGMGIFRLESVKVTNEPDQKVELYFSESLSSIQSLIGLIQLDSGIIENYELSGNKVTIYPDTRLIENHKIQCSENIKNYAGFRLKKNVERTIHFERTKPKLRMIGKGTIVPDAKGVVFPFETMALKAVDVWIYQIHEKNIPQFLQVNDLAGNNQLSRVGTLVHSGKVDLTENKTPIETEWTRYTLNIRDYINKQPGAIYRVLIGYRSSYTFFDCKEGASDYALDEDGMYHDYYNGENNNLVGYSPCDSRFYYSGSLCRNILASDIGLIVKKGADNKTHVFVSSLITAQPLANTKLEFYTYQNTKISTTYVDQFGMAQLKLKDEAYMVVASSGNQKGYLKLGNGRNNSTSKFEVGGVNGASLVDGKIYTERGVWRPGDSIYTCFTLQDKQDNLPPNAPVTFELVNPQGQVVQKMVRTTSVGDVYDFRTATQTKWATGNYTARVKVGGSSFYKTLAIETVKPNRLKILLSVKDSMITVGRDNEISLQGKWLHGAVAPDLKYNVKGRITPVPTIFDGYRSFDFDDKTKRTSTKEMVISEGTLDENGEAKFKPDLSLNREVRGSLKVDLMAKIFEKGGNFSQDYGTFPIKAYKSYVGIESPKVNEQDHSLVTDKRHQFRLVNVTDKGQPISGKKLQVKIYKIDWNWWWDNNGNLSTYMQSNSLYPVLDTIVTTDGKGLTATSFSLPYPNWGRFVLIAKDPVSNHRSSHTFYIDWPYYKRGNRNKTTQAKTIVLTSNKTSYGVNEKVDVTIPSSDFGRALVCVENGSSVLKKFWVTGNKGETKFSFRTTAKMTPNVYVHVSYLQTYKHKDNDLPARLYGILPIKVENKQSHLEPQLIVKDEIRPDRNELVQVKEKYGRPMTYTLAVVDEGLLDLTHFKTPKLWNHFYQKQGLGVRTWDLYDEVMGGYAGKYGNVLSVGGDEEGGVDESVHKANRFKPAVKFLGPFKLKQGETARHFIEMGAYIGAVRMMVIARKGDAYGEADKSVKVKKPIMILPTLPRVLSPGETVQIPVTVFSLEEGQKTVSVSVKSNNGLKLVGPVTKDIVFNKSGDETIYFMAEVAEKVGVATIEATAKSGTEKASKSIEIAIRTPNPQVTDVTDLVVQSGQAVNSEIILDGLSGTNNCAIEVSALPPLNLHSRLDQLLQYPHGCVEQTTSSVFAQLFLDDILTLSEDQIFRSGENIQAAIRRLKLFQNSTGGLGYWSGAQQSSPWGSNYAGHFLLLAQNKGYKVDKSFMNNWLKYQQKEAKELKTKRYDDDLIQAYRLYTLVLAGKPDLASMNRMRESNNLKPIVKWRLAAAYAKAGMPEVASSLINNLEFETYEYNQGHGYTFGSRLRDKAMILETLGLLGEEMRYADLMKEVSSQLSSRNWLSTQETAYSLIAISGIYKLSKGNGELHFDYTRSGHTNKVKTGKALFQQELIRNAGPKVLPIQVKNKGEGLLFVRLIKTYVPLQSDTVKKQSHIALDIKYVDYTGLAVDPNKLEQGTEFKAIVRIKNGNRKGYLKDMALSFMMPTGWEIENTRMFGGGVQNCVYRDFRDDRVYTYFNIRTSQTLTYEFKMTATYVGRFYQPTVSAESMYDNTIVATQPGGWVEVVERTTPMQ